MNLTKTITLTLASFFTGCFSLFSQTTNLDVEKEKWLKKNVHVVDNVEPGNTNFRQFQALKKAIGDRRIVLLGEQTHGDGTTFKAKVRLVKFLHHQNGV